jgi:small-conductance mechanosensitive channel
MYWIVSSLGGDDLNSLSSLLLSGSLLLTANIAIQLFDVVVWGLVAKRGQGRVIPRLLFEILNVSLVVAAALLILNGIYGIDLSTLLVTSTVISAVIGLALQDMLGNVVSGLAVQFDRSMEVDDWIFIDGQEGRVVGMNWRTVTIVNLDNHAITIPNSNIAKNHVVNFSKPSLDQRLHVFVGLPYGVSPGVIKRILMPAVVGAEGVSREPPPEILVSEYGDSAIVYDVRFWVKDYSRRFPIQDDVLARIWYAIRRAGVSVPFPIRDVNLRTITDEKIAEENRREKEVVFSVLRTVPIFEPLSDEQVRLISEGSRRDMYYAGEVLVRQGARGDSLFVVQSGRVRVEFLNQKGVVKELPVGPADEFFGEMSLLTGERRRASVIAATDMRVIVVEKSTLANVLRDDLTSLKALTEVMEKRIGEMMDLADADLTLGGGPESENLFSSISKFLGVGQKDQ